MTRAVIHMHPTWGACRTTSLYNGVNDAFKTLHESHLKSEHTSNKANNHHIKLWFSTISTSNFSILRILAFWNDRSENVMYDGTKI